MELSEVRDIKIVYLWLKITLQRSELRRRLIRVQLRRHDIEAGGVLTGAELCDVGDYDSVLEYIKKRADRSRAVDRFYKLCTSFVLSVAAGNFILPPTAGWLLHDSLHDRFDSYKFKYHEIASIINDVNHQFDAGLEELPLGLYTITQFEQEIVSVDKDIEQIKNGGSESTINTLEQIKGYLVNLKKIYNTYENDFIDQGIRENPLIQELALSKSLETAIRQRDVFGRLDRYDQLVDEKLRKENSYVNFWPFFRSDSDVQRDLQTIQSALNAYNVNTEHRPLLPNMNDLEHIIELNTIKLKTLDKIGATSLNEEELYELKLNYVKMVGKTTFVPKIPRDVLSYTILDSYVEKAAEFVTKDCMELGDCSTLQDVLPLWSKYIDDYINLAGVDLPIYTVSRYAVQLARTFSLTVRLNLGIDMSLFDFKIQEMEVEMVNFVFDYLDVGVWDRLTWTLSSTVAMLAIMKTIKMGYRVYSQIKIERIEENERKKTQLVLSLFPDYEKIFLSIAAQPVAERKAYTKALSIFIQTIMLYYQTDEKVPELLSNSVKARDIIVRTIAYAILNSKTNAELAYYLEFTQAGSEKPHARIQRAISFMTSVFFNNTVPRDDISNRFNQYMKKQVDNTRTYASVSFEEIEEWHWIRFSSSAFTSVYSIRLFDKSFEILKPPAKKQIQSIELFNPLSTVEEFFMHCFSMNSAYKRAALNKVRRLK